MSVAHRYQCSHDCPEWGHVPATIAKCKCTACGTSSFHCAECIVAGRARCPGCQPPKPKTNACERAARAKGGVRS